MMTDIRIIKHELLRSKCGSFEVQFSDGRPSKFFYWDDVASRPVDLNQSKAGRQQHVRRLAPNQDLFRHGLADGPGRRGFEASREPYRGGKLRHWIKVKNRQHLAFSRVFVESS